MIVMPRHLLALRLLLLLAAGAANAQAPDSVPLPRVVVTATRVDTPLGAGLVASSVIDHAALQRSGVRDVADALRLLPELPAALGRTELAFFLRLENALDARYEEIANYPAARRALSVGLRAVVR